MGAQGPLHLGDLRGRVARHEAHDALRALGGEELAQPEDAQRAQQPERRERRVEAVEHAAVRRRRLDEKGREVGEVDEHQRREEEALAQAALPPSARGAPSRRRRRSSRRVVPVDSDGLRNKGKKKGAKKGKKGGRKTRKQRSSI